MNLERVVDSCTFSLKENHSSDRLIEIEIANETLCLLWVSLSLVLKKKILQKHTHTKERIMEKAESP